MRQDSNSKPKGSFFSRFQVSKGKHSDFSVPRGKDLSSEDDSNLFFRPPTKTIEISDLPDSVSGELDFSKELPEATSATPDELSPFSNEPSTVPIAGFSNLTMTPSNDVGQLSDNPSEHDIEFIRVETEPGSVVSAKESSNDFEFPIRISDILARDLYEVPPMSTPVGRYVLAKPFAEEYEGKTFLGVLVGSLPLGIRCDYQSDSQALVLSASGSFEVVVVPQLAKLFHSENCSWSVINTVDDLRAIGDDKAVQALAELAHMSVSSK